ncbi:putative FecCD-family membrane transport protein [Actinoplanes missouriensis 431]|uniref:Putative FecCD-family membrane transport protein n=1 Tax=Actinoplanes missouriensis (strain ATCC 14538 / DSM 43046 / CBS 188.64 / JCM 3121 / NBRC 102363 / NCIMB 12654 / NRRL B-3342 / UNCC 431) TaxID=512565 RepID=I0HBX1_ACTM4|nr:iron chelate uptake ABC transporter family permease subunit [Actinoplanes missouriensis]BAL90508.1 putative FecCD-family membrane transport protein [Actinoplanes missouriensis 431]
MSSLLLPGRRVLRAGPVSASVPIRTVAVTLLALVATVAAGVAAVGHGDFPISPETVWQVATGGGTRIERHILLNLRLPRVLCGLLAGAALAVAGALTQTFARNPLASPDVLGVTFGASAGAVTAIVLGIGAVPFAALGGALLSAAGIYLLAWKQGIDGYRLVLIGLGAGQLLAAVTSWLLLRADQTDLTRASIWLTGSLAGRDWSQVRPLALALLVLLPAALATGLALRVLQFGDDTARGLGLRLPSAQLAVVVVAAALAAAAVAAAGPIEFVAFVVPQIALRLCGGSRPPLVASAVLGALLVVGCDLLARIVVAPAELPVGLVTAIVGTPYLLWLLVRGSRRISA